VPRIITAALTSAVSKDAPGEIVYIPVGANKINATVNGKAAEVVVNVPVEQGAAIAASLQASLEKRLASTVRPRLAFDHSKAGPASGHPQSFSFDPARGIILAASWSNSGKAAIEGGDYGYFSPTFHIDDKGFPSALPEKGEIGSLVDEPAFRNIGLVAAADSETEANPIKTMSLILAHLGIDTAAEGAESAAVAKIQATEAELATIKAANAVLVAAAEAATKARHEALIEAAVTAGKIAPKDEETKTQSLELLQANEALGTKFLTALPVALGDLGQPLVKAGQGESANADIRVEAACVKARAELGNADFGVIWERAAEIDPSAFN
jgi:phage I-like protein